jgi:hypothetical protein
MYGRKARFGVMRVFNNVILGLDPRIQTTTPPLDSRFRGNDRINLEAGVLGQP